MQQPGVLVVHWQIHQRRSQGCWCFCTLPLVQEPGMLVVHWQIHQCRSHPCWCFCNSFLRQCTTQLHCSVPSYYTSVLPSSSGNFVASYTSVSASSTGYIVPITPGVYIRCTPAQEPALLTFCEGVVTSSAGDFVAEWALLS